MPNDVTRVEFDLAMRRIDERFDTMERRVDSLDTVFVTKDEFNTKLDEVMVILRRLDQERIFTLVWIRRIDADVALLKERVARR